MHSITHWQNQEGDTTHYIWIDYSQVIVGSHHGNAQTSNVSVCSYNDFVKGCFHAHILSYFNSEVLNEVLYALQYAENDSTFSAKRRSIKLADDILYRIPFDISLADLRNHPDTENGAHNYGNSGGYKTIVCSDTAILSVERDEGFVITGEGKKKAFNLSAYASSVVALNDYFYLVVSDDYMIIDPDGCVLKKAAFDTHIFGEFLRLNSVRKLANIICFDYFWLEENKPRGWLKYELGVGFTGRWQEIRTR